MRRRTKKRGASAEHRRRLKGGESRTPVETPNAAPAATETSHPPLPYSPPRRPRRRHTMAAALVFSTLLHLSMVTLFNIVIYFPREDLRFVDFRIVQDAPVAAPARALGERLRVPSIEEALDDSETDIPLPDIELPTLEFAELDRLRVGRRGLDESVFYGDAPRDSWGRFGRGLQRLGRSLTALTIGDEGDRLRLNDDTTAAPPALRPAEGFVGHVAWSSAPQDRRLLFAPPIEALWDADLDETRLPITLVIKVNASGRVVNAWTPNPDASGLTDRVGMALLKYRFEPLSIEAGGDQMATLVIEAEGTVR